MLSHSLTPKSSKTKISFSYLPILYKNTDFNLKTRIKTASTPTSLEFSVKFVTNKH